MASLVSLVIETEEAIRLAIHLRALKEGVTPSEAASAILRKALAAEIEEASGLPPLAAVIQNHHNRQHEVLRQQQQPPKTP